MEQQKPEKNNKPSNPFREKIRQNKIFFYGLPVLVVMMVFTGLFYFILPGINFYLDSSRVNEVLDGNNSNIDRSINNMNKTLSEEPLLRDYDAELANYIPKDPKLGDVLNMIQAKAQDFNLESKVGVSSGANRTSVGNLAKKDADQNVLFQSISSGEIYFKPKSLNKDINAILMSIEVNVKGDKKSFLSFLEDAKKLKPLVNLVFVEYNENSISSDDPSASVNALLRFESYALKFDENVASTKQNVDPVKDKDYLQGNIPLENFNWSKDEIESYGIQVVPEE